MSPVLTKFLPELPASHESISILLVVMVSRRHIPRMRKGLRRRASSPPALHPLDVDRRPLHLSTRPPRNGPSPYSLYPRCRDSSDFGLPPELEVFYASPPVHSSCQGRAGYPGADGGGRENVTVYGLARALSALLGDRFASNHAIWGRVARLRFGFAVCLLREGSMNRRFQQPWPQWIEVFRLKSRCSAV